MCLKISFCNHPWQIKLWFRIFFPWADTSINAWNDLGELTFWQSPSVALLIACLCRVGKQHSQWGPCPTPTEVNEVFLQTSVATGSVFTVIYGSCFTCPLGTRARHQNSPREIVDLLSNATNSIVLTSEEIEPNQLLCSTRQLSLLHCQQLSQWTFQTYNK